MQLVADIGNTHLKLAVFEGDTIVESIVVSANYAGCVKDFLHKHPAIKSGILSSVAAENHELVSLFPWLILSSSTSLPFANAYDTPHTLGMDRVAAVAGAMLLFPKQDILVIDLGTCIKYNVITAAGVFVGGAISPGITMRFKAMNTFTDRLPQQEPAWPATELATTTADSLQAGVLFGALQEMQGMIHSYSINYPNLKVILTGGDAYLFEDKLKMSIFVHPQLNLLGLHSILNHHAAQR